MKDFFISLFYKGTDWLLKFFIISFIIIIVCIKINYRSDKFGRDSKNYK